VVRFQWLAFASIAKTSDAMVGHKASRSKGARSLAKAFYSELLTFPTSRTVPSNRPNRPNPLARMPFQPELATVREGAPSPCNGNVRLDREDSLASGFASEQEKRRGAGDPHARLTPARHWTGA
jgi:hypothetical protein